MTAATIATLFLAAAVLITPPPARHRLLTAAPARHRPAGRIAALLILPTVAVAAAVASPALALAGAAAAATAEMRRRRWVRRRRRRDEARALAAALDALVGDLGIGADPLRALTVAASESADEVGCSLRAVTARAHLGADVAAGIQAIATDSSVPAYWDRLAVCWQLAAERGLAMSTLMRAAYRDIVERQRFSDRIQAALAGARATAVILAALPALGVLLGEMLGAGPLQFLLGTTPGGGLLVLGVGLVCAGILWADRIIDGVAE